MTIRGGEQRRLSLPSLPLAGPRRRRERKGARAELVMGLGVLNWTTLGGTSLRRGKVGTKIKDK